MLMVRGRQQRVKNVEVRSLGLLGGSSEYTRVLEQKRKKSLAQHVVRGRLERKFECGEFPDTARIRVARRAGVGESLQNKITLHDLVGQLASKTGIGEEG